MLLESTTECLEMASGVSDFEMRERRCFTHSAVGNIILIGLALIGRGRGNAIKGCLSRMRITYVLLGGHVAFLEHADGGHILGVSRSMRQTSSRPAAKKNERPPGWAAVSLRAYTG